MSDKNGPRAIFEVPDADVAFRRLELAAQHIMSVPKKKIAAMMEKERTEKKKRKRH